jgi:putative tricarboxylic transport membrane protein
MAVKNLLALSLSVIVVAGIAHAPIAAAAEYPDKPVSFIVHSSPGSGTDVTARTMANILEQEKIVRQRVVIENKTGGSGVVAINYVMGKTGDPYTIWIVAANVVIGQPMRAKMKVTYKDFTPIAMLAKDPSVIAVRAESPFKTVKDLIAAAKEKPKGIIAGASSVGGAGHITAAMFATGAGVQFGHVFFKGGAEAVVAALGGHVDFVAENPSEVFALAQAKKLRLLGTATDRRLATFPDVPTLRELGIDAVFEIGRGVFGPKDLPRDVVKYWGAALEKMVKTPAWKKYLQDHQMVETFLNDGEMAKFLDDMAGPLTQTMTSLGLLKE